MKISYTSRFDAPLDRVVEALCGEAYNVASEQRREGVISTQYKLVEQNDNETVFEMHSTEYKRKKTGGLDRSATTNTVLHNKYIAASRSLTWIFGDGRGRLRLSGVYHLTPQGDGVQVVHDVEIEVHIPLLGNRIAKYIAKQFKSELPANDRVLRQHLG